MYKIENENRCHTDYLVLYSDDWRKEAIGLAKMLRDKGFIVECDSAGEIVKHIKNAGYNSVREIIKVDDETVSIIDINSNQTYRMKPSQFIKSIEDHVEVNPIH